MTEESLRGRVVYASSNGRWKGAAYIFSLGFWLNQDIQSEVRCSWTWWQIQERVTGEGVEGSVEVDCLVSALASSLPGMSVCPGTQWTVMVESVLLMSVAISWMRQAISCPGPWVRYVVWVIATWLSVNMWIRRWWSPSFHRWCCLSTAGQTPNDQSRLVYPKVPHLANIIPHLPSPPL
jgi:hypothetical protein